MQDDDGCHEQANVEQARCAEGYDAADEDDDGDDGNDGHRRQDLFDAAGKEMMSCQAEQDRYQDHFRNGNHHGHEGNVDPGACQEPGQGRRHNGCQERRRHGHRYGQGDIALSQVGNDIRCRPARAGPDEDDANSQFRRQGKETDQGPGHEGHDDELGDDANEDFPRPLEDGLEILNGQGHAHAEHDDTQEPADIRLDPLQGLRPYGADDTDEDDENGHVVYQKITTLFQPKNLPIGIWGKRTKKHLPAQTERCLSDKYP